MARAPAGRVVKAKAAEAPPVRRPVSLDEVAGHARAKGILRDAVASGRVHHAWVFHGPRGVGKFTSALAWGAELLTPAKGEGREHAIELLRAGRHPDLHVVNKELASISSDSQVRSQKQSSIAKKVVEEFLLEPAGKSAIMAGTGAGTVVGKVFVVDEAELLQNASQDSMLKTLEEPHPGTVIILVTSAEGDLRPTVLSRCQRVAFAPLTAEEMKRWVAGAEAGGKGGAEEGWLLKFAGGAPGVYLQAQKHGLFEWSRTLEPMLAGLEKGQPAPALGYEMGKLVEARAAEQAKSSANASKEQANRVWSRVMLGMVIERFRERLASAGAGQRGAVLRAIDVLTEAEGLIDQNVQFAGVFDHAGAELNEAYSNAGVR